jgi:hypothetical protein
LALLDHHHLWRQAKNLESYYHYYDDDDGNRVAILRVDPASKKETASGMRFDPDLSVMWREHLEHDNHEHTAIMSPHTPYDLIFEASVGEVRALRDSDNRRYYVAYTPIDEEPLGCAHASVLDLQNWGGEKAQRNALRTDLARLFKKIHGELTIPDDSSVSAT